MLPQAPQQNPFREPEALDETDGGDGSNEAKNQPPQDSAREAQEFFRKMRVYGDGPLPLDRYEAARTHAESMRHYSLHDGRVVEGLGGLTPRSLSTPPVALGGWNSLGPGNIGGRTRSLLINPANPKIMYAGAVSGGVWKSVDAGQTWTPLTDLTPTIFIGTMIFDPADPAFNTIYAGTGESYTGARGGGILKTTDGGNTWSLLPATATSSFWFVNKLAITPNHNLYAATSSGIFTSADAGATWNQSFVKNTCDDLVVRTDVKTDYLFTDCLSSGAQHAIYRNTDAAGAGAWINVQSVANMARTSLALAPSQQTTIYSLSYSTDPQPTTMTGLIGVFRSTQNGDSGTWTKQTSNTDPVRLNTTLLNNPSGVFGDICSANGKAAYNNGQGWYDNVIAVDPLDPNRVWAGGIDTFRSDDGGANWGIASYWERSGGEYAHADNHVIVFHPAYDGVANQTMYLGNDGGLFRTDNARAAVDTAPNAECSPNKGAIAWTNLNNSYTATQFYHGLPYPGGAAYMGGAQDNGTSRGQIQTGVNGWAKVYGGDGGWVGIDPIDPNNIFFEYVNLATYFSSDGGLTLADATHGITENSSDFQFIKQIAMDPSNSKRLYVGGSILWQTNDGAHNWSAVSSTISTKTVSDSITGIAVAPSDPNTVFFGTVNGFVYSNSATLTANANTVWTSSRPRTTGSVAAVAVDPSNVKNVYAVYTTFKVLSADNHVYKSTDGGATWAGIDGFGTTGIPDIPVSSILIDPLNPLTLYLGTDLGVYVSTDGGASWSRDANAFANTIVSALSLDRSGGASNLYAFTYGRGAWKVALPGSASPCSYALDSSTVTLPTGGGSGAVKVTTGAGCVWTALPGTSFVGIQSPAIGTGSGSVYYTADFNYLTAARTDTFTVQGQTVTATQGPAARVRANDEIATAIAVPSLPYGVDTNPPYTDNSTDPVHSCTGSADHNSAWWMVTAPAAGAIQIEEYGYAVVSAYPLGTMPKLSNELACLDGTSLFLGTTSFEVTAGTSYLIEESLRTADTVFTRGIAFRMLPPIRISISPVAPTVAPGQSVQLGAAVAATSNVAVRWSLSPPVGTISSTGLYTAPSNPKASQVTVTASSMQDPTENSSVTLSIQGAPASPINVSAAGVTNAATFAAGPVAPGEIITIFGAGFGPASLAGLSVNSAGRVSSAIGTTQVTFDGVPAPLVYAVSGQLSAVVPYEVAGKETTVMLITDSGNFSQSVTLPVTSSAPAFFTLNQSGRGQVAMVNQDGSINGPSHPAPKGSVVTVYGTGEGSTVPASADGQVNSSVYPKPLLPSSVTIGGQSASITYLGAAPGFVAGVLQVNVTVPANAPSGDAVPVVLTIGTNTSPVAATMAVQ
jgi:uncharacterized protein (TIGR03437 family)